MFSCIARRTPAILLATLLLSIGTTACGSDGGGGDGGSGGTGGTGGGTGEPFAVNAALGLTIIESPFANEGTVAGEVLATRNGDGVAGATVKLNGVVLPENRLLVGFYETASAEVEVAAGETMLLEGSEGGDTASIAFPCPPDVTITAPAEGATFSEGDTVEVRWTGNAHHNDLLFNPVVTIRGYDADANEAAGMFPSGDQRDSVERGTSSGSVVAPSTTLDGFVVALDIPGLFTTDRAGNAGICYLRKRIHLVKN